MIKEKKLDRIGNYREDGKKYKNFSLVKLTKSAVRIAEKVHIEADDLCGFCPEMVVRISGHVQYLNGHHSTTSNIGPRSISSRRRFLRSERK